MKFFKILLTVALLILVGCTPNQKGMPRENTGISVDRKVTQIQGQTKPILQKKPLEKWPVVRVISNLGTAQPSYCYGETVVIFGISPLAITSDIPEIQSDQIYLDEIPYLQGGPDYTVVLTGNYNTVLTLKRRGRALIAIHKTGEYGKRQLEEGEPFFSSRRLQPGFRAIKVSLTIGGNKKVSVRLGQIASGIPGGKFWFPKKIADQNNETVYFYVFQKRQAKNHWVITGTFLPDQNNVNDHP